MIFSGKLSKLTAVKLLKLLIPNSAASQKLYSVFSPSMNDHCSRVVLFRGSCWGPRVDQPLKIKQTRAGAQLCYMYYL